MTQSFTLCVNKARYFHRIAKREISAPLDLLSWLSKQDVAIKVYWKDRDGKETAAIGSVLQLDAPPYFEKHNDSPARFWGGHAFFPYRPMKDPVWNSFPKICFFLPHTEITKHKGKITVITNSINAPLSELVLFPKSSLQRKRSTISASFHAENTVTNFWERALDIDAGYFTKNRLSLKTNPSHFPSKEHWNQLIQNSLEKIHTSVLDKVVLARRSTHVLEEQVDPFAILSLLPDEGNICFAIQFHPKATFIGATPERLFKREERQLYHAPLGLVNLDSARQSKIDSKASDRRGPAPSGQGEEEDRFGEVAASPNLPNLTVRGIYTEALAGTRKRGITEEEDRAFEKQLLENPKELLEFSYVKKSMIEELNFLCDTLSYEEKPSVLKTFNLQHLHTAFTGTLREGVHDVDLLHALHPTPAMGGSPKSSALEYLFKHEPFERGWYASPLGYCSPRQAEFAVAIRSALIEQNRIHFFAGTGIVKGSSAEKEWEEIQHKIALWNTI